MKRVVIAVLLTLGLVGPCLAGSAAYGSASLPRTGFPGTAWHLDHATRSGPDNAMAGITATGRRDAWAVGTMTSARGMPQGNGLRWNGRAWVPMKPMPRGVLPFTVRATAPGNVWVVGEIAATDGTTQDEALRWNGTSWQVIAMPRNLGSGTLVVIGPSSVWFDDGTLWHWNGTAWRASAFSPGFGQTISGTSARTLWAVTSRPSADGQTAHLVARRWTGSTWLPVHVPHPAVNLSPEPSIAVSSAHNIWIEVHIAKGKLILHWNGHNWSRLTPPSWAFGAPLVASGRNRVWAGANALWSGGHWVEALPFLIPADMAAVPGTNSTWLAVTIGAHSPFAGAIYRNGPVP